MLGQKLGRENTDGGPIWTQVSILAECKTHFIVYRFPFDNSLLFQFEDFLRLNKDGVPQLILSEIASK